jgi:hypothetical protein
MVDVKLGGLVLLALGLCLACEKKDGTTGDPTPSAGTSGSGGSSTTPVDTTSMGGDSAEPVRKGERGSSCDSTADCEEDLTCIVTHDCPAGVACANKSCQPSNFNLMGTGKRCHISECKTKADCCGDMPAQAPAKCANRDSICTQPTYPGCTTGLTCVLGSDTCGKGTCSGRCNYDGKACLTSAECAQNTCDPVTEFCTVTQTSCSVASGLSCTTITNTCTLTPTCNCVNPDYEPTHDICTDEDCEGICGFTCEDDRCVVDDRCAGDEECPATTPFCNAGTCGECRTTDDCDDEACISGHCGPECKADTQCGVFEACQQGACVYVGCRSDRECVLQAGSASAAPSQDPRLAKCSIASGVGTCVMPCEIDAQCAPSEVCLAGVCKYIGCETDSECKTIAGIHDLPVPTPERPWSTTAVCQPEDSAAP